MHYTTCLYSSIYASCVIAVTWPIFGYLLLKWYQYRNHFVIRNRWPILSLAFVGLILIIHLLSVSESLLCIDMSPISMSLSNTISGLVYYRAHLLYVKSCTTQHYLNMYITSAQTPKTSRITVGHKSANSFRVSKLGSKLIIVTLCITSLSILICRYLHIPGVTPTAYTITTLIGIISVVNLLRNKVNDSIGCATECLVQIGTNCTMPIFFIFSSSLAPSYIEVNKWAAMIVVSIYGFTTLFTAVYLIQKADKRSRTSSVSVGSNNIEVNTQPEHVPRGLSVANYDSSINVSSSNLSGEYQVHRRSLKQSLDKFLKDNSNFILFARYLGSCFALENFLFLERAIILYHIISKYANESVTDHNNKQMFKQKCYQLKFMHLTQIYSDIENIIHEKSSTYSTDTEFKYKSGIIEVMKMIYNQFCQQSSDTEINISYNTMQTMHGLFQTKTNDQISDEFKTYQDMLKVFHAAIVECWNLCDRVYQFQFRSYARKNATLIDTPHATPQALTDQIAMQKTKKYIKEVNLNAFDDLSHLSPPLKQITVFSPHDQDRTVTTTVISPGFPDIAIIESKKKKNSKSDTETPETPLLVGAGEIHTNVYKNVDH